MASADNIGGDNFKSTENLFSSQTQRTSSMADVKIPASGIMMTSGKEIKSASTWYIDSQPHIQTTPLMWLSSFFAMENLKNEILAGLIVGLEQVGEAIAFALLLGIGPQNGLHAAWIIGLISLLGPRSGMISSATGAQIAVLLHYMKQEAEYGLGYLGYILIFTALFQSLFALTPIHEVINLIPHTVMIGFFNGISLIVLIGSILYFHDSVCDLPGDTIWKNWLLIGITFIVTYSIKIVSFKFKVFNYFPLMFIGIVLAIILNQIPVFQEVTTTLDVRYPESQRFPRFFTDDKQFKFKIKILDWNIIWKSIGPAFTTAIVGAIECIFTMNYVESKMDSDVVSPLKQFWALSFGNLISGMFGTTGGGAAIRLSAINIKAGANENFRTSQLIAILITFIFAVFLQSFVNLIPLAGIVGISFTWSTIMFNWKSAQIILVTFMPQRIRHCKKEWFEIKINRFDALIIILVSAGSWFVNPFNAILFGILLTSISYAWESGKEIAVQTYLKADGTKVYKVQGPLFFGSFMNFIKLFRYENDPKKVEVDFSSDAAQVYDYSAIYALGELCKKYEKLEKEMKVTGLNEFSNRRVQKAKTFVKYDFTTEGHITDADTKRKAA